MGVSSYLAKNKNFSFVELHLPSLGLASEIHGGREFDTLRVNNISRWKQVLKWQSQKWNRVTKAFVPNAEIDVIKSYRIN